MTSASPMSGTCGQYLQGTPGDEAPAGIAAHSDEGPVHLVTVEVRATAGAGTGPVLPYWLRGMIFSAPGSPLHGVSCSGSLSSELVYEIHDAGVRAEEPDAPVEPPPGVEAEDWSRLNRAEKVLLADYYATALAESGYDPKVAAAKTAVFVARLLRLRNRAIEWAEQQRPYEASDATPRNALQHAYWQCLFTREFDSDTAERWGFAHEDYEGNPRNYATMDLYNNSVGRQIAGSPLTCEAGVLDAMNRLEPPRLSWRLG